MHAEPQKEHLWLNKLLGEWAYEHDCSPAPDQPKEKFKGTETVRSLGGLWVVCEGSGNMPGGGAANTMLTLGYDPARERYVGSWIGSMMTHLWTYEGALDPSGRVLTLNTEGPNFTPGATGLAKYQDVIEFLSDDHRTLTSRTLAPDGSWNTFMTAHYRRTK